VGLSARLFPPAGAASWMAGGEGFAVVTATSNSEGYNQASVCRAERDLRDQLPRSYMMIRQSS
jgi:hypothetical protein